MREEDTERELGALRAELHAEKERRERAERERDELRRGYQRLAANGHMTDQELAEALMELEKTRATAERQLEALTGRRERLEQLEQEKDTLLENYAALAPEALESLEPEERHHIYKMLRLKVIAGLDGSVEVNGAFGGALPVCELGLSS